MLTDEAEVMARLRQLLVKRHVYVRECIELRNMRSVGEEYLIVDGIRLALSLAS